MKPHRADEDAEVTGKDACATLSSEVTAGRDACATLRGIVRRRASSRVLATAFVFAAMVVLFLAASARADEDREQGNLWPGESHAFLGVTVTWEVSGKSGSEGTSPEGARMDDLVKEREMKQIQSMMPLSVEGGVAAPGSAPGAAQGTEPGAPGAVNALPAAPVAPAKPGMPGAPGMPAGPAMQEMGPGMMMEGGPGMMGGGYGAGAPGFPFPSLQGTLRFKGPKTEVGDLAISPPGGGGMNFYIDGVYFEVRINADSTGSFFLEIGAWLCPAESDIAGPPKDGLDRVVSSACPIRLNNWKFTVSKEPVAFPDGSSHLELRAINTDSGEETAIPLVPKAMRKTGRFTVKVQEVSGEARTARLRIDADGDPTIKGRLAWVRGEYKIDAMETLKEFVDSFGHTHEFNVEWISYPDHPESIQQMQDRYFPSAMEFRSSSNESVEDVLDGAQKQFRSKRDTPVKTRFEWKDDTHLQVIPENYDTYLAAREKEEKKLAASKRAGEERDAETPRFKKLFADQYGLQTKIYKLDTLTPVTARTLVEKELWKYFLGQLFLVYQADRGVYEATPIGQGDGGVARDPEFTLVEKGRFHAIGRVNRSTPLEKNSGFVLLGSVQEEAIADDKANALIVTAIPATHVKIATLLEQMQSLASKESPTGPPPAPYRISAVLLQGVQAGAAASTGEAFVPSVRANDIAGVVKEIPVKVGEAVSMDDVLVRLDPATLTTSLIDLYTRDLEAQTKKKAESGTSTPDVDREIEDLKRNIQSERRDLAMNHQNEIRAPRGQFRVSSIHVKEGSPVILGQEILQLRPFTGSAVNEGKSTGAAPAGAVGAAGGASPTPSLFEQYGLRPAELKSFGIESVSEMGKGIVSLVPEKGDIGVARIALGGDYTLTLTFLDERSPYVVVKGTLQKSKGGDVVIENTLYLEADKPTLLGVTNLREALILIVRRFNDGETPGAAAKPQPKSEEPRMNTNRHE